MSQVEVQKIEDHTTSLAITAAVICVLLTIFMVWLKRRFIRRASTVLIVGLNDAGKTILFSKLINQSFAVLFFAYTPHTYSSLKENVYDGFMDAVGNELTLVDFPGAERLRKQLFANYFHQRRSSLRGILFMVDSATFSKKARDVAEFLYDVLYESAKKVSVLVACNKQDISLAKSSQAIRSALEREFGLINGTREAALESTAGDSKKRILTDTGRNFQWKDLHSPRIEFLECCVAPQQESGELVDLEGIQKWVNSL